MRRGFSFFTQSRSDMSMQKNGVRIPALPQLSMQYILPCRHDKYDFLTLVSYDIVKKE